MLSVCTVCVHLIPCRRLSALLTVCLRLSLCVCIFRYLCVSLLLIFLAVYMLPY